EDSKAPDLDGFTAAFFKKSWRVIGNDVCKAVKEFFSSGRMLGEINATLISLIPKVETPNKVTDFRLIAYWFTINVNEDIIGYFKGGRGLRQGDPVSPYIFTLIMDIFSLMLKRHINNHPRVIKSALDEFSACSGLLPNNSKSTVFFGSLSEEEKSEILNVISFTTGKLPVNMLKEKQKLTGRWPIEWREIFPMITSLDVPAINTDNDDKIVWRTREGRDLDFSVRQAEYSRQIQKVGGYFPYNSSVTILRRRNKIRTPNIVEPELRTIVEVSPMVDNRTMEELLQATTEGYGEAIVILEINADHFVIKTNLLQLVQRNLYHGFERENPHTHINNFKRITLTLKFRNVPNDVIKLMMFSYSLKGSARVWYDKEHPNSILTWEDLVNKFVNQFFPPLKTTHLKNKISRFTQRFEETFGEVWERFKEMLRACPQHGFTELAQINTFYNGLNDNDQDSLNVMTGGNLLSKTTREALQIIENKLKVRYSRNKPNVSRINTTSRENASKTDDRIDK
nr:reverse transcriptase domain-containing protein [Tanacetum cinerariifolium]